MNQLIELLYGENEIIIYLKRPHAQTIGSFNHFVFGLYSFHYNNNLCTKRNAHLHFDDLFHQPMWHAFSVRH